MRDALIVVDVQNDFCLGGSLAVPQGDAVVPVMNRYMQQATESGMAVFASRDWHPRETRHFAEFGGPWPVHCVQNTPGAEFHPQLRLPREARIVTTGTSIEDAGYSAFEGTLSDGASFPDELRRLGVRRVHVGGLAPDYCVRATVLDALAAGFETYLLQDASRPVDVSPGDGERAVGEMLAAGAQLETVDTFAAA
jgi:nicotinamidase/pyrazinamidase